MQVPESLRNWPAGHVAYAVATAVNLKKIRDSQQLAI